MVHSRAEVLKEIQGHRAEIEKFCVTSISIFGSAARDELTATSDVDVLVDYQEGQITFDNYMGLKFYLEDLFGRKVDLATQKMLKPRLKTAIAGEIIHAS